MSMTLQTFYGNETMMNISVGYLAVQQLWVTQKPPPHAEAQARKKFLALESVQAKPPLVSATNLHMDSWHHRQQCWSEGPVALKTRTRLIMGVDNVLHIHHAETTDPDEQPY